MSSLFLFFRNQKNGQQPRLLTEYIIYGFLVLLTGGSPHQTDCRYVGTSLLSCLFKEHSIPDKKSKNGPDLSAIVPLPVFVFLQESQQLFRMKELTGCFPRESFPDLAVPRFLIDPHPDWHRKAQFSALRAVTRQGALRRFPEEVFCLMFSDFCPGWQAPCQFKHIPV